MKKLKETLALRFIQLVFVWVNLALAFQVFMLVTHFTNPELSTKIGNEIMWKIDGTFKNDPNNMWYEGPSKQQIMIFPKRISNNIFFKKEFIDGLLLNVPKETMNYWGVSIIDTNKIEGVIRYINGIIDVIYIVINCKKGIDRSEKLIKFNLIEQNYVFDSIYIKYDVKTDSPSFPIEYRYDNDLNVIATYKWNNNINEYLRTGILTTQYKDNIKLKEYILCANKKVPESFKELTDILIIPESIYNNDIEYLSVKDNQELLYYYIK